VLLHSPAKSTNNPEMRGRRPTQHPGLYNFQRRPKLPHMNFGNPVVLAAIILIVLIGLVGISARYFTSDARLERRRRRNNYRVVSKSKRPIATLSVRTKK